MYLPQTVANDLKRLSSPSFLSQIAGNGTKKKFYAVKIHNPNEEYAVEFQSRQSHCLFIAVLKASIQNA